MGTRPPERAATPSAAPRADVANAPSAAAVRMGLFGTCVIQSTVPVNVEPVPPVPPPPAATCTATALAVASAVFAVANAVIESTAIVACACVASRDTNGPTGGVAQLSPLTRIRGTSVVVYDQYPRSVVVMSGRSVPVTAFRTLRMVPEVG